MSLDFEFDFFSGYLLNFIYFAMHNDLLEVV